MFGLSYIKLFIIVAAISAIGYSYVRVWNAAQGAVYAKLKDDRITLLKDGKAIDDKVLQADDDELRCLLVDCTDGVPNQ